MTRLEAIIYLSNAQNYLWGGRWQYGILNIGKAISNSGNRIVIESISILQDCIERIEETQ